jgi:L-asparagine transporter-like permease
MIALGGVISTGLFFGSAKSIHLTGPSIVLSYILGGIVMFIIMRALGEMTLHNPTSGSFSEYANNYLGRYAGFIAGWNAWFAYTIVCMVELSVVSFFLDYWFVGIPHWLICLVILVIFMLINFVSVRIFGEFEFWFAGIKIVAIVLMLVLSAYLIFYRGEYNHQLWSYKDPQLFFAGGIKGFAISLVIVFFSFGGTEFISIAAGEAENPQKIIPRAINGIVFRIILFYILTMLAIICLYPFNKLTTNVSPFVDVFAKIGIHQAALVMNIVAITAALSAFNSCLYSSSRMLYSLALNKNALPSLSKISKNGMPHRAVLATTATIFITVIINYLFPEKATMYLLTVATCSILITWFIILISQISFRRKERSLKSNFRLFWSPYSNLFAIFMLILVMFTMTQMDDMKWSVYITPIWVLLLSVIYWLRNLRVQHHHNINRKSK